MIKSRILYREILKGGILPLDRIGKMSIEELNTHTEACELIVERMGQIAANQFAAQYLLMVVGSPLAPSSVKPTVKIKPNELTTVELTDEQFDKVENNVKLIGGGKSGELLHPRDKKKYKN